MWPLPTVYEIRSQRRKSGANHGEGAQVEPVLGMHKATGLVSSTTKTFAERKKYSNDWKMFMRNT